MSSSTPNHGGPSRGSASSRYQPRAAEERNAVPNRFLDSDRREHFTRKLRATALEANRKARDDETRRMEEYRRLCKKEGIQSKRLEEYDKARTVLNEKFDEALEDIDKNQALSAAEKKRRKFNLKRKAAMRESISSLVARGANPALKKMEKVQQSREAERQRQQQVIADAKKEHEEKIESRKKTQRLYAMRTKSGQPLMRSRMECLLSKIQQHASKTGR
jgi:hypothetical protein